MDLAAALTRLIDLATSAAEAKHTAATKIDTFDLGDFHRRHYLLRVGDQIAERETPPPEFACQLDHLDDLIDVARGGERGETPPAGTVTIWHDQDAVIVRRADLPHAAYARLTLRRSEVYQRTCGLAGISFTQRDFIRLIRSELPQAVAGAPALIDLLRQLKFTSQSEATGTVQLGRESMGRSIDHEVTAAGQLPETVTLTLPMYENSAPVDSTITVEADLDIDLLACTLGLRPIAAQLIAERQRVAGLLHDWLQREANAGSDSQAIAVYRGRVDFED